MNQPQAPLFERGDAAVLAQRLSEPRRLIQVVAGARQVGKTTLVGQVLARSGKPCFFISADEPFLRDGAWLATQWEKGRKAADTGDEGAILALDEIQKIPGWSETVKRLWDEDTRARRPLRVILLGSAPLLVQRGLGESLAGRFEVLHLPHWSFSEMRDAFGFDLERYLFFGGFPGAAPLADDVDRWRRYLLDSLIETTLSRDVLLLTRVEKPALLRQLFQLGCRYSGQIVAFNKLLGQLQDAGNTTTLAHYLDLLDKAGMLTGLQKYAGQALRQRGSSPKFQAMNTAYMTALEGLSFEEARSDGEYWGRLTESAVGAHLANAAARGTGTLHYWRDQGQEVDFVLKSGRKLLAIEVKSSHAPKSHPGLSRFMEAFRPTKALLVGGDGIPVGDFLSRPVEDWL